MATPSKIPLRGIADLFNHLDPGPKAQIQAAFAEAEDYINYSNVSVVGTQDKRKLSAAVAAPIVTATTNSMGFDVQWDRLSDRRISSYEVQVSYDTIFSNPDTYQIVNTSFSLEGIGTTVFVRVRGVRFNGDCGPWSDSVQIDAFAQNSGPIAYSRNVSDVPSFYVSDPFSLYPHPIQRINITPQRQNGGIMIFGSVGVKEASSMVTGDFIQVTVNENLVSTVVPGTIARPDPHGSFAWDSIGFGPVFLSHGDFYTSQVSNLNASNVFDSGSHGSNGTHTGWTNPTDAEGSMETVWPATTANYTVSGLAASQHTTSKYLNLEGFGFSIPSTNTIRGIKVSFTGTNTTGNLDPAKSSPLIYSMNLLDAGTPRTYNPASLYPWPPFTIPTPGNDISGVTFGSSTDLWGEVDGFWTPSKINSASFGVALKSYHLKKASDSTPGTSSSTVNICGMEITVYSTTVLQEARIDVFIYSPGNTGTLANCTLNVIEFGSEL